MTDTTTEKAASPKTDAGEKAAVHVEGLVKRYGDRTVLKGVSYEIGRGEVAALVGPSGGGKSTALRCMTALETFHGGTIRVASASLTPHDAHHADEIKKLRLVSGLVFQTWHLFPHMTALENVHEAPVQVKKEPLAKARDYARHLLEKVGLSHREGALPRMMSGGEQQRCAIARALAMRPEVLFMDEPTSALDPQRVGDLVELLQKLTEEEKLTLVVVTHEMKFAMELANRVLVLYEGNVIENGHPKDILAAPTDPRTRKFLGLED
ncbi:MAG: amino acid ABC transporter ATP-binding protein [Sandaracinus sp.]